MGVQYDGDLDNGGAESNMGNAAALKTLIVDNKLGGEILTDPLTRNANGDINQRDAVGIDAWTFGTLNVKNAGRIVGGSDVYRDEDDDGNDDDGWFGAAINAHPTLILANAATGIIDGGVQYSWINNKIDNLGTVNGTIAGYVKNQGNVVDLDRDGDFGDFGSGGAANASTLVGVTLTNKGIINGEAEYGHNYSDWNGSTFDTVEYYRVGLDLGLAKDTVTNSGKIFGEVWLGEGDDKFTNSGTVQGYVDGWIGNDIITNSGVIEYGVGGGAGNDTFTNSKTVNGSVNLGEGNDILKNTGLLLEYTETGDDNDTITNSGTIGNQGYVDSESVVLDTGNGADVVTNSGPSLGGCDWAPMVIPTPEVRRWTMSGRIPAPTTTSWVPETTSSG